MHQPTNIQPHRITKPIQLVAAWLIGLIAVDGAFLATATQLSDKAWMSGLLVIASVLNVPIFLGAIFVLQTRFRPEMQEDTYYSRYLETQTGNTEREVTADSVATLREDLAALEKAVSESMHSGLGDADIEKIRWTSVTVLLNKNLKNFSELARALSSRGIPVHETFGGGAGVPGRFSVAVGKGFDVDQIRQLVEGLLAVTDGWISYAHDDDEVNQYDGLVLIGAYGSYGHGIELSKMQPLLEKDDLTSGDLYRLLGIDSEA